MAGYIPVDIYYNGVLRERNQKLIIPYGPYRGDYVGPSTMDDVLSFYNETMFNTFGIRSRSITVGRDITDMWNVFGASKIIGLGDAVYPFEQLNDYIEYRVYSNDGHARKIRVVCSGRTKTDESLQISLTAEYYLDGVKVYYTGMWPISYVLQFNPSTLRFDGSATISTLPWCTPDNFYFGSLSINVNYSSLDASPTLTSSRVTDSRNSVIPEGFSNWLSGFVPDDIDDGNPYWEGGTSNESDDDGNFSEDSDDVNLDSLPIKDAVGTGFATIFTPDKAQLSALADVMWDQTIFTTLQNLVQNISDMFTSLAVVPFEVTRGRTVSVTWFNWDLTGIDLTLATKQYYEFDMGSINLANDSRIFTSGSALDYSPYSKLGIFLPFIGFQELDIDECRGTSVNLKYRIDILSGTCVAIISVNGNAIYQFTGNCLTQIPITNENIQSVISDAVQVGIAATATHAASGAVASAGDAVGAAESAGSGVKSAEASLSHAEAHLTQTKAHLASATANAAMGMKPTFGKAGAVSAAASLLAVKQPYLFLTTPRQSIPNHYQRYCGFPSNISGKLSEFSGYTVVEEIRLNGLTATSTEISEIDRLLKTGVII